MSRFLSYRTAVLSLVGTAFVFLWLCYEVSYAGEEAPAKAAAKPISKNEIESVHKSLELRETALVDREEELKRREQQLVDKEALLKEQLGRYEVVVQQLREEVKQLQAQDNKRVESFRQIYGQMEPKRAAKILNDLDLDMSGRILSSLKEERSAQILGRMTPAKAKELTEKFFARRALAKNPSTKK